MTELETRSIKIKSLDEDSRTIRGLAAVWNSIADINGDYKERFERGAFVDIDGAKLYWNHKTPIGVITRGADTDEGYEIEATISRTLQGDEAYTLVKDGVIDNLSVGFVALENRNDNDVLVRTKAKLKEVSLVPFGAYAGAQVSEVRANQENQNKRKDEDDTSSSNMENENEITEIRSSLEVIERDLSVLKNAESNTKTEGTQFRSAGEWIKALAENDDKAKTEVRAYTGAVLADSHTSNDWKSDLLKIVDRGRPVLNLFERGPLGAQGNSVEYPKVSGTTGDVAVQATEGTDLAYLEVGITTATAPVKTYGGYSELSRQAIERSDVAYLETVLRFQAASYAKVTNKAVLDAVVAATPQTGTSFTLASAKGAAFIDAVVDGITKIDTNGQGANAEFVFVSPDVYAKLASLSDSADRPLFNINGDGANTIGSINPRGIAGSLAGLPVVVGAGLAAKTFYVASSTAVMTWENAGAPLRLQDENIINLTKQFSLYGYMAVGVKNAAGLVKATVA